MKKFSQILIAISLIGAGIAPAYDSAMKPGVLIKGEAPTVYFMGPEGTRLVFPNEGTYFTWYPDFSTVRTVSEDELQSVPVGGSVTYRPGVRLLKSQHASTVYAISRGGVLRPIVSGNVARDLYGASWPSLIDVLPDSLYATYTLGLPIVNSADYHLAQELSNSQTIAANTLHAVGITPSAVAIGPNDISGRVMSIAIHPGNENIAYVGTAEGGIFKTFDRGEHWTPSVSQLVSMHVSALAIDPQNPDTVYAGTGEIYTDAFGYEGVYVTHNGGATWSLFGDKAIVKLGAVSSIAIDTDDSRIVYVSGDRGIFKTADGGRTWKQVAYGFIQNMERSLADHNVLFATGKNGLVLRSTDLGEHWTDLRIVSDTLPKDTWFYRVTLTQSIGRSLTPYAAHVMYLAYVDPHRLFRSDDGGTSWHEVGSQNFEGMKNYAIVADPADADVIFTAGTMLHRATDGGYYATEVLLPQFEVRAISFAPSNPDIIYLGTDNGIEVSKDGGYNWLEKNVGLTTTQWYDVNFGVDSRTLVGAVQDFSTIRVTDADATAHAWGETRRVVVDAEHANTLYALSLDHGIGRSLDAGNTWTSVTGNLPTTYGALGTLAADRITGGTLYASVGDTLRITADSGETWGSLGNGGSTSPITVIEPEYSPRRGLFVGRADGSIQIVTNVFQGVPRWTLLWQHPTYQRVVGITAKNGTVTAALSGGDGIRAVRLSEGVSGWVTKDISADMPGATWARSLNVDNASTNTVYFGHYNGLLVGTSVDGVTWHWDRVSGIPSVEVSSIATGENGRTVLSTFGRGLYELQK